MPDTRPVHERAPALSTPPSVSSSASAAVQDDTPQRAGLLLKGQGYISVSGQLRLSHCKSSFSIETWIYISRTEALHSESSLGVRKHNGLIVIRMEVLEVEMLCPMTLTRSWCPVWEGDTQNIVEEPTQRPASCSRREQPGLKHCLEYLRTVSPVRVIAAQELRSPL